MENNNSYYHLSKIGFNRQNWKVGDEIIIGDRMNNYFNDIYGMSPEFVNLNDEKFHLIEYTDKIFSPIYEINYSAQFDDEVLEYDSRLDDVEDLAKNLKWQLFQYIKFFREFVFEEIRKNKFSNKPSRQKCLWVCKKDHLGFWIDLLKSNNSRYKIFELQLNGNFFETDGQFVTADTFGLETMQSNAEKYWSFDFNKEQPKEPEILFEGHGRVINEFNSLDEIL